jgi:hypothetical protein
MTYTDLTDEEYDALDEEMTRSVPVFSSVGSDWLALRELRQLGLTQCSLGLPLDKSNGKPQKPGPDH